LTVGEDMYNLRIMYAVWKREMRVMLGSKFRFIISILQPFALFIVMGKGFSPIVNLGGSRAAGSLEYSQFVFPGMLGMILLFTAFNAGTTLIKDREFGILKGFMATPAPGAGIIFGKIFGTSTQALIQIGILFVLMLAVVRMQISLYSYGFILAVVLLTAFTFSGLSIFFSVLIKGISGYQQLTTFLRIPMFLLGGAMFPLVSIPEIGNAAGRIVPAWMVVAARLNPFSYAVDALRYSFWQKQSMQLNSIYVDIGVLLALTISMLLFSVILIKRKE